MVATALQGKAGSSQRVIGALAEAKRALLALAPRLAGSHAEILDRLLADLEASRFHAEHADLAELSRPLLLAVLGGTGTGKSTLVNRLCGAADGRLTRRGSILSMRSAYRTRPRPRAIVPRRNCPWRCCWYGL